MSIFLLLAGIAFFANGAILLVFSNINLGVVLTALLGLVLILWGIFYRKIQFDGKNTIVKAAKRTFAVLIAAELLLVSFIAVYGQSDNVTYNEDAVIVLGAGLRGDKVTLPLKMRLDTALKYHAENPDAYIVVTGGQGFQETVTEASAMAKYLAEKGVPEENILKEELATSTNENMRFSKDILYNVLGDDIKIAVITNNFHIYRSVAIAKSEGFESVSHMHAGLQWYNLVPCYIRESLAVLKMNIR